MVLKWILCCFFLISTCAYADESLEVLQDRLQSMQRQVLLDKQSNQLAEEQLQRLIKQIEQESNYYKSHPISNLVLKHADLELASAQARLRGMEILIDSATLQWTDTGDRIEELVHYQQQQTLLVEKLPQGQQKLADIELRMKWLVQLQEIEKQRLAVLEVGHKLAQQRLTLVQTALAHQHRIYQRQEQNRILQASAKQMVALQSRLQGWLISLANLQEQSASLVPTVANYPQHQRDLQVQILTAEEHIALLRTQITVLRTEYQIEELRIPVRKVHSVAQLHSLERNAKKILSQLEQIQAFTKAKNEYLDQKKAELKHEISQQDYDRLAILMSGLQADYYAINFKIIQLEQQTEIFAKDIRASLKSELAVRQTLPHFTVAAWMNLGAQMLATFSMVASAATALVWLVVAYLQNLTVEGIILLVGILIGLCLLVYSLQHFLEHMAYRLSAMRNRFSSKILYGVCLISARTLVSMLLFALLLFFSWYTTIQLKLFLYLVFVYIAFKWAIQIAHIALVETDVQLYQRLKWTAIFGGVLSSFVVITHLLPVDITIKALSNRIFMLFVLILGVYLFKGRHILPNLVQAMIPSSRHYMHRVVRLLTTLLPLAFISNALIGLCGYVELAFAISKYQAIFLGVLAGYLIIRGLMIDLLDYLAELLIRHTQNGWILSEALLKPLDRVLRVVLLIATGILLIHIYDLDKNATFLTGVSNFFHYTFFHLGGNAITLLVLIKIAVIVLVLFWLSRWTREFSFRRLYVKARDAGVRNSLSIFTQYGVVILGVLLGLKLIGLDLGGFAVVAAAFAAGLGFGLRDMANNFFSGILLLVERPFRTGDIVTLGDYEGEVIHTGLRSLMIRTWDRMDVIVPNADMFTKAFTNWTHQDSIVRTVINIKIHRSDDPHRVKQVILDTLANIKAVIDNPEVEIFMQEIDDALIQMDVRYYVVVSPQQSRAKVRSEVLFALWDAFRVNNIHPPYQKYDIHLEPNA